MPAGKKGKKTDGAKLEDSNMAGYGGKQHKDAKKAAAETEEEFKGAGAKVGIEIWRVENQKADRAAKKGPKFGIKKWPVDQYGQFYTGDSYIVLETYKLDPNSEKLSYDVHFWLGATSTQDERGVAAYKTVELDDLLDDLPVQFRQVQAHESPEFLKIFDNQRFGGIRLLEGGIESGFNKVKPTEYTAKLFQLNQVKGRFVKVVEVPVAAASMNQGDVFVLDNGLNIFQWNGRKASFWEKRKGMEVTRKINDERNGKAKIEVLEHDDDEEKFWSVLGSRDDVKDEDKKKVELLEKLGELNLSGGASKTFSADSEALEAMAPGAEDEEWDDACVKGLYKIKVDDDNVKFQPVACGGEKILKSALTSSACYLLDVKDQDDEHHVYVHVGSECSKSHQQGAISYGVKFLKSFNLEEIHPVCRIVQGKSRRDIGFAKAFDKEE